MTSNQAMRGAIFAALTVAASLLAGVCAPTGAWAEDPVTLRFAYSGPPTSPYLLHAVEPWAEQVMKDSDGALKIDIVAGARLASMGNTYDRLVAGVFDIGFSLQGSSPGKFQRTDVVEFPYLIRNATAGSRALWRLYEKGLLADEYAEVKPLALFVFTPCTLHFHGQVKTKAEIKGLKVSSDTHIAGLYLKKLGAIPVSMTPNELYTSLRQNLIQGITAAWTGITQFKLQEVTDSHIDVPFGAEPGYVLMNKQAYERLSPKAKAAIDKNSGLPFSLLWGEAFDASAAQQHAAVSALSDQTIVALSPEEDARFQSAALELRQDALGQVPNGPALMTALQTELQATP